MPNLTDNINLFQPTGFKINISRSNYPNLEFFAQTVTHPGLTLPAAEVPYSRISGVAVPGDKLTFGELSFTILLDEDLNSYIEIYNWMIRLVNEEYKSAYSALLSEEAPSVSDISISILTSHNNPNKKIKYIDAIPVSLGDISMEANNAGVEYVVLPVSFRFSYFTIE